MDSIGMNGLVSPRLVLEALHWFSILTFTILEQRACLDSVKTARAEMSEIAGKR